MRLPLLVARIGVIITLFSFSEGKESDACGKGKAASTLQTPQSTVPLEILPERRNQPIYEWPSEVISTDPVPVLPHGASLLREPLPVLFFLEVLRRIK